MRGVRFLFQTFSRNDLPGEASLSRGRSVFKKKKKICYDCHELLILLRKIISISLEFCEIRIQFRNLTEVVGWYLYGGI